MTQDLAFRKKCPSCKTRFTLLPADVVPLHSYGLKIISARLRVSLEGKADRCKEFYEQHGLIPDEANEEPLVSWSDQLNSEPLRPSHQLFRHWRRKWASQAQAWLHCLLLACLYAGCDLRQHLARQLEDFCLVPPSLNALALAVGLKSLIQEDSAWNSFTDTVFLLSFTPAHKILRADGRPPPQYGGARELKRPLEM